MTDQPGSTWDKRILFVAIGVAIVALVLGVLALGFFPFWGGGEGIEADQATTHHSGVSAVRFDLDNASLEVRVGGTDVVVERTTNRGEATETASGASLLVEFDCPAFGFECRGTYLVTVPAGTELSGGLGNGRITLLDIDGRVELSTSNGSIEVEGASGQVLVLSTSNGSITGSNLITPAVDFRTSNGRIEIDFAEAPRSVRARTSNGRIEVVIPSGAAPYAIEASASNGRTDLGIATDPGAELTMELTTFNGNVLVGYRD